MMANRSTVISTKGQVILPKVVRDQRGWSAGTRLIVEDTPDGVLLKTAQLIPTTQASDVFGCLAYGGPPKTIEDMHAGIAAEVKRRHDRDRY